ncbi:MAG: hypothetical protein WAM05_03220, partial [Candidatus Binataceae bacterium]
LRAVLDQLVHSLFELRKGYLPPAKRRMQFPICKCQEDFCSRIKPDLEGLEVADIELIKKFQPYHGRNWLWELKLLAEEHKHRKLIFLQSGSRVQYHASASGPAEANYIRLPIGVGAPKTMNVNTRIAGPIALRDGTSVVDQLEVLQAEVIHVVGAFEPLFDRTI